MFILCLRSVKHSVVNKIIKSEKKYFSQFIVSGVEACLNQSVSYKLRKMPGNSDLYKDVS